MASSSGSAAGGTNSSNTRCGNGSAARQAPARRRSSLQSGPSCHTPEVYPVERRWRNRVAIVLRRYDMGRSTQQTRGKAAAPPGGDAELGWIDAGDGYALALDAGKLVARNAKGKRLSRSE